MNTYSERNIDKYVEKAAKDYAAFVNGTVEHSLGGFCVSSKWENVFFGKKYVGTEHYYVPVWDSIPMYIITAHIYAYIAGKGDEKIEIML
jgi:hypothetical protein